MPRTLMIYFSQGGTTGRIAEKISDGLKERQYQSDLYNIIDGPPPEIKDYDMIGIGSPVYIFRPPFNILDYIKSRWWSSLTVTFFTLKPQQITHAPDTVSKICCHERSSWSAITFRQGFVRPTKMVV